MEQHDKQNWTNPVNGSLSNSNSTVVDFEKVAHIVGWVTFAIGLPAICLAIYMLSQLVKGGNGTPVQAINLLISDIFNLFTRPQITNGSTSFTLGTDIPSLIFYFGVASSIVFMVGVAQERHLLVTSQWCHGCCRKAKQSSIISLAVWLAPIGIVLLLYFGFRLAFSVCLLLPFPLLVFFFLDSCRAMLCCSTSVSPSQRRRVLAMLVTILSNYTILFLPFALIALLATLQIKFDGYFYFGLVANLLLYLSPVINPFLSMLLTKSLRELADTLPCCRRKRQSLPTEPEPAESPVVFENPNVALPLANTGNTSSVATGNIAMFPPTGMGMAPNGISTVFQNISSIPGLTGQSTQVPTVPGGLSALSNVGMTCSEVPAHLGDIPMVPTTLERTDTIPQTAKRPADSPVVYMIPNVALILVNTGNTVSMASGNIAVLPPTGMGMATNDVSTVFENCNAIPGMPGQSTQVLTGLAALANAGMTCSVVPTLLGNQTKDPTMPARADTVPQTEAEPADSPVVFENPNAALPLANTGNTSSMASGNIGMFPPAGIGMTTNGVSTIFQNISTIAGIAGQSTQVPTVPGGFSGHSNVGMTCSEVPAPSGNLIKDPTTPKTGDTVISDSGINTRL